VACILKGCAHGKGPLKGPCRSLGMCGAKHVLELARRPGGYDVLFAPAGDGNNPTVAALLKAGLVIKSSGDWGVVNIKAAPTTAA
jgi:hypothetical protein